MLTTSRASRRRLLAGFSAVTLIAAGGLGLTASGSQAAEVLKNSVDEVLQAAPAAPATVPVVAPAVQLPPIPPMPAAPAATRKRMVVVTKDGKTATYEGADADRYIADHALPVPPAPPEVAGGPQPPRFLLRRYHADKGKDGKLRGWAAMDIPEVSSATCPGDAERPTVENSVKNGKRRIVICTNRIERMTRDAERLAANSALVERRAMFSARSSLAMARAAIETDRSLSDDQRRQALAGIAQAEAELKADTRD